MHKGIMMELKGVAVRFARERAGRGSADVGKEKGRRNLRCEALKVQIIPRGRNAMKENIRNQLLMRVKEGRRSNKGKMRCKRRSLKEIQTERMERLDFPIANKYE